MGFFQSIQQFAKLSLAPAVIVSLGLGCASSPSREPAAKAPWEERTPEQREARRVRRQALRVVRDYHFSEGFAGDLEGVMEDSFEQTLEGLEARSDDEVRSLLRAEMDRATKYLEGQSDLTPKQQKMIQKYIDAIRGVAESVQPGSALRQRLRDGWERARPVLYWSASSLAYVSAATMGAATLPFQALSKFVVGLVRGERLGEDQIRSERGSLGDRPFEGMLLVSGGSVAGAVIFHSLLAATGVGTAMLGAQVFNSVALIVACGGSIDGDVRARRVCTQLRKIYAFYSKTTDFAAIGGVRVHEFFEKHVPIVLRRKDRVSRAVCRKPEHSARVVRRVLMRHSDKLMALEGVEAVESGTTADHPVRPDCSSVVITLKPGYTEDDVAPIAGRVIDGVHVVYKPSSAPEVQGDSIQP